MKIAIIGPGALGLLFAGYLHRGGAEVVLADEDGERADLFNREGVRWEGDAEDFRFTVPAAVGLTGPETLDLVVLCVKAYHTRRAAGQIHEAGYRGPVLTLQNGLGNGELIEETCPGIEVIAGATSEGASLAAPNHVRHAGGGETVFGPLREECPGREFLDGLAGIMNEGGLSAALSGNPQGIVWSKAVVNAGINPLTAVFSVENGKLLEIEPARSLMAGLVDEAYGVARRKGVAMLYDDPVARVEEVCRLTASNYSSMCLDVRNRRRTEIDFINGAVVREGAALGMACPLNDAMVKIIRGLEISREGLE
ncbi:MAG: 2-dehydropantoate 2-reductase [Spirochaetes bacterium]|nr:2-dehydropantoate 2-reductase [Spirochaetota bacterium]